MFLTPSDILRGKGCDEVVFACNAVAVSGVSVACCRCIAWFVFGSN